MTAKKYRKKPIVIEAMQFDGENTDAIGAWAQDETGDSDFDGLEVWDYLHKTWIAVKPSDWIVKGTEGEHYPVASEVFAKTYEVVE